MDSLQPGDPVTVGGYRLLGRLGSAGMGQVFLGSSPGGRRVAVKLIHSDYARTSQFRARFAREIEAARRVGGFHTAPVVDADPDADPPWMITAYIQEPPDLEGMPDDGDFQPLVTECLAKAPEDRPPVPELLGRLTGTAGTTERHRTIPEPVVTRRTGHDTPATWTQARAKTAGTLPAEAVRPARTRRRRRLAVAVAVAAMASAASVAVVLSSGGGTGKGHAPPAPADRAARGNSPRVARPALVLADPSGARLLNVAFGSDGTLLASTDAAGRTYLWSMTSGRLARVLHDPSGAGAPGIAFSPDATTIATGDLNGHVYLWNVSNGTLIRTFSDPQSGGVSDVAIYPNGKLLAASDFNHNMYIWEVASGRLLMPSPDPDGQRVLTVAFSPKGGFLASTNFSHSTYLWDLDKNGELYATLHEPASTVNGFITPGVGFSPDGTLLATADGASSVCVWNLNDIVPPGKL